MRHEIFFQNPVFNQGLNVTVRDGEKWMEVDIGDILIIKESGSGSRIASGNIIGKALLPVTLIPEDLLKYEHDPSCRNLTGLTSELKRVYPNFAESNLVTILLFTLF